MICSAPMVRALGRRGRGEPGVCGPGRSEVIAATEAGVMRMAKKAIAMGLLLAVTAGAVAVARWLGLRPDPRMAQVLKAPGALEQWAGRSEREGSEKAKELKPLLVAQAEAFALCLNPPKPPQRPAPVPRPRIARPEVKPTAAPPPLRLMGISYHRSNPAESRALVGAPDGGCRWAGVGPLSSVFCPPSPFLHAGCG